MSFYCSNVPSKMFYGSIGADCLRNSRGTSKIEDLSRTCKQLLSQKLVLNKKDPTTPRSFYDNNNKSIEEVMQAIGF